MKKKTILVSLVAVASVCIIGAAFGAIFHKRAVFNKWADAADISAADYEDAFFLTRRALSKSMIEMIDWFEDTEDMSVSDVEKGIKGAAAAFSEEERREYGSAFTAFCLSQGLGKNVIDDGGENIYPLADVLQCSINELTGSSLVFSVGRTRTLIEAMESGGDLPENEWRPAKTACLMRYFLEKKGEERKKAGLEWEYDTEFDAEKAGGFFQVFCAVTGLDYAALFPVYLDKIDYAAIVYEDSDFGGSEHRLSAGEYDLNSDKVRMNEISSLKVTDGFKVTLFEGEDFDGRSKTFTSDANYVGDDFNDITNSIRVERM